MSKSAKVSEEVNRKCPGTSFTQLKVKTSYTHRLSQRGAWEPRPPKGVAKKIAQPF